MNEALVKESSGIKGFAGSSLPLPIFIGLRYLRARKSNRSISFFSSVSLIGLSLGLAAIIVVLSVMNGFESEMHRRILGMLPHISVENDSKKIANGSEEITVDNWLGFANRVLEDEAFSQDIKAAAPFVNMDGMLNKDGLMRGIRVVGIDPVFEKDSSVLNQFVMAGNLDMLSKPSQNMLIGSSIAREMGIIIGDELTLVFPIAKAGMLSARYHTFKVTGFFHVGAEADGLLAFINLNDAAQMKYQSSRIDGFRFQLFKVDEVDRVEQKIADYYSDQFQFNSWKSTYGQLFQTVKIEKVMTASMLMLIVLIAAFNTVSSLSMLVAEKHTGLAVLATMGFTSKQLVSIFLVQGMFISFMGIVLGLVLGLGISYNLEALILWVNHFEFIWVAPLKAEVEQGDVLWVSLLAFIISMGASILPAMKAAKIQPADAVRYH